MPGFWLPEGHPDRPAINRGRELLISVEILWF